MIDLNAETQTRVKGGVRPGTTHKHISPKILTLVQDDRDNSELQIALITLTHISLVVILWDIGSQHSPRCEAAERGIPSGAILFA